MGTKSGLKMETKSEKKAYLAPSIRVVKFNVEIGYEGSVISGGEVGEPEEDID